MQNKTISLKQIMIFLCILALLLAGCSVNPSTNELPGTTSEAALPLTEIIFQVTIPEELSENTGLAVEILDETTGLAFNATRYPLQPIDAKSYFVRVTVPIGAILKYRFLKLGDLPTPEYTALNVPIRYRMYVVPGPAIIQDSVAAWIDTPFTGSTGTLEGQILSPSNSGVPHIYVTIDGISAFTDENGSYSLSNLPVGTHNLVAYSLDGSYSVFQQGALIAENATTPAIFQMSETKLVNISFDVSVPEGYYTDVPVRIVGSLYQLGNSFADLEGGLSTLASRGVVLTRSDDGHFRVTTQLPVGTYIEFKYSLGDGFWNAERQDDGRFRLRKIIVPDLDTTYQDTVVSWMTGDFAPVTFDVTDRQNAGSDEMIYIQFNPYAWTNPIPMWKIDNNHWYYTLYSPFDLLGQVGYRYCRNEQCGVPTDVDAASLIFTPSSTSQSFHNTIGE